MVYSDVRVGVPIPDEVARMDNNVVIGDEEGVCRTDEAFWEEVRPYRLSEKEKGIYSMVDSVQNVPLYRNIYTINVGGTCNANNINSARAAANHATEKTSESDK